MNLKFGKLTELSEKILPLMQEAIEAERRRLELARQIRKIAAPDLSDERACDVESAILVWIEKRAWLTTSKEPLSLVVLEMLEEI